MRLTSFACIVPGMLLSTLVACGGGNRPGASADSAVPSATPASSQDSAMGGGGTADTAHTSADASPSPSQRPPARPPRSAARGDTATGTVAPPPGADTLNRIKPNIDSGRVRPRVTIPDSAVSRQGAMRHDSAGSSASADAGSKGVVRLNRRLARGITVADSMRWPVKSPAARSGALLPGSLIIAYYGNPYSKRMGILGQIPPNEMLTKLERTAAEWAKADTARTVRPALHLIATVAQEKPGKGAKYRLQMPDKLIDTVAAWAESKGWLLFLDVQIGHSTVEAELPRFEKWLQRPYVHLALDPEFAMTKGGLPGKRIGTLDAEHVNWAIRWAGEIVDRYQLPPKVMVVHRFTRPMLTGHDRIRLDPRVQVVVDMDGFGSPRLKQGSYNNYIVPYPVEYTGFKLFYKNDKPMMTEKQVLDMWPIPSYIQYQ